MTDTPSWLQEGADAPTGVSAPATAPPAPAPFETTTTSRDVDTGASNGAPNSISTVDESDLPSMILIMRLANMGVAVALMTCSILLMLTLAGGELTSWVLAIYATCGGLLICCLETQLKFVRVIIAVNFGFLFHAVWRFFFYLLLSSVAWTYKSLFGRIIAACLVAAALFNTYVLCRYPSYRKMREKIAEEEDKRIEARISKEVKRQAMKSITS